MLGTNKSDLAAHSAGIELVGHGKLHEEKLISLAPFFWSAVLPSCLLTKHM